MLIAIASCGETTGIMIFKLYYVIFRVSKMTIIIMEKKEKYDHG